MGGPLHRLPADRGAWRVTDVDTALVGIAHIHTIRPDIIGWRT